MWNPNARRAEDRRRPPRSPANYLRADVRRVGRRALSPVAAHEGGKRLTGRTTRCGCSSPTASTRSGNPIWRIGTLQRGDGQPRGLHRVRRAGLGLERQRLRQPRHAGRSSRSSGRHTIRIQQREDGISIDQVVLSAGQWVNGASGVEPRDDTTILPPSDGGSSEPPPPPPPSSDPREIVMYAAAERSGGGTNWQSDGRRHRGGRRAAAESGSRPGESRRRRQRRDRITSRCAFTAEAGVPYHLWVRSRATNDYWGNDSVFVQFSDSVDASGAPIWRIGSEQRHRRQPRGLQRLRRAGLGLERQRLRLRSPTRRSTSRRRVRRRSACSGARTASRSIRSCCRRAGT